MSGSVEWHVAIRVAAAEGCDRGATRAWRLIAANTCGPMDLLAVRANPSGLRARAGLSLAA
ncbi:hypothetical protein C4K05_0941 [Pseudomonas chlororaphis subsp. aureofaciens]|nr:hypothetical protein C4K14_0906 [Pseudomonas chlororaphis subsp. aureofaciens]AZE21368.1 hypothetical protein C4K08_0922 [Pseudomonas chlororaphis subsp. aureofaciens]AZE33965.1 hypothetical protein C4K06_0913 [Pseudomonas chlororaphis subsp. aureofaciens]AZE40300.1 hypothetical protein C4K05_0941 [Pseudomonas chlororaphis subsp. aureofaciens]